MSWIDLSAVDQAVLQSDPFDFIVAPGFIPADRLRSINRHYPAIESAANFPLKNLRYGPNFSLFLDALLSPALANRIGLKFGVNLSNCPTTVTVRKYCERSDGNIHTDHRSKLITVLVYFNESWPHETGKLRLLRSASDIEDYGAEVEPNGGALLAFRRTPHSWHGHKQFVGERRMLQLNFLSTGLSSILSQRFDRFTTHFHKRVLGIR